MEPLKIHNNNNNQNYEPRKWLLQFFHEINIINDTEWLSISYFYIQSYSELSHAVKWIKHNIIIIKIEILQLDSKYFLNYKNKHQWSEFWLKEYSDQQEILNYFETEHSYSQFLLWQWCWYCICLWQLKYNQYITNQLKQYNITLEELNNLRIQPYIDVNQQFNWQNNNIQGGWKGHSPSNNLVYLSIVHNKVLLFIQIWQDVYLHAGIAIYNNIIKWSDIINCNDEELISENPISIIKPIIDLDNNGKWWPMHIHTLNYSNSYLSVYSKTKWLLQSCIWKELDNDSTPYAHIISKGM